MTVEFTVPGAPFGKQRPRHTKGGHTYTPEQTKHHEKLIAWAYCSQCGAFRFPDGTTIELRVTAYWPIPARATKSEREAMLSGEKRPTVKPDYDNIAKLVSDALNGIAFDDDRCIVDAMQRKFYLTDPRTVVIIREAGKGNEERENDG